MKMFSVGQKADRNKNGVINAIDDTLNLIKELRSFGYSDEHIKYLELEDGKCNVPKWWRKHVRFL